MISGIPGKLSTVEFTLINNYGTSQEERNDIRSMVIGFALFENIFCPFMYGSAKIRDSYSLYSTMPISTDTYILIRLHDPMTGKQVSGMYKIYKISDFQAESQKLQTYIIQFVSAELFSSQRVRVNKHITGNVPTAVQEIHKLYSNKPIEIDKDAAKANLYLPMITAHKAIPFLLDTIKWKAATPDYCYWETFYGFRCKSISSCVLNGTVHDFSTNCQLARTQEDTFQYADFIKIDDLVAPQAFDSSYMIAAGYAGETVFTYNPLTFTTTFEPLGEEPLARLSVHSDNARDYISASKRAQILSRICETYYYINVPGLLTRSSGDMADVTIYNGNNMNVKDATFSGKRLICGIAHIINADEYKQNITLGDYTLGG